MNILIYRTSSIGDVVLTTALLSAITAKLPESKIIFISRQPQIDLLKLYYPTVDFIEAPKEKSLLNLFRQLKRVPKIDLIVDLQVNLRSVVFLWIVKLWRSAFLVRMEKNSFYRNQLISKAKLNKDRSTISNVNKVQRDAQQFRLMLRALQNGLKIFFTPSALEGLLDFTPKLSVSQNMSRLEMDLPSKFLAICLGAAHETKKIPLELLSETFKRWAKFSPNNDGLPPIVFLGSKDDYELSENLIHLLKIESEYINLAGKISFAEVSLVLQKANLLVSNDSALAHVCEAVGTPVAVFFGPTAEAFGFAPWSSQSRAFSSAIGCRPCSKHGKSPCRYGDKKCFYEIDMEEFLRFCISKF